MSGEIAIAFQLVDEKLHQLRHCTVTADDVFLVHSATMGDWATDKNVSKIAHDGKVTSADISGLTGICF